MSPQFFSELSGESKDMPLAEAVRCLEAETDSFEVVKTGPGYMVASFDERFLQGVADRIALTHSMGLYWANTPRMTSRGSRASSSPRGASLCAPKGSRA